MSGSRHPERVLSQVEWRAYRAVCRRPDSSADEVLAQLTSSDPSGTLRLSTVANALAKAREKGWLGAEQRPRGSRLVLFYSPAFPYEEGLARQYAALLADYGFDDGDLELLPRPGSSNRLILDLHLVEELAGVFGNASMNPR